MSFVVSSSESGVGMVTSEDTQTGWYVWAGDELSQDPEFFEPLHVSHLPDRCPEIVPYLALPPGWRVLLAPGQEDVWFDDSLL